MLQHTARAVAQFFDPGYLSIVLRAGAMTLAIIAGIAFSIGWLLSALGISGNVTLDGWLAGAGSLSAFLGASIFLIAPVSGFVIGLFAEEAVQKVENRYYADSSGHREAKFGESMAVAMRFGWKFLVVNTLALPFYLMMPGINIVIFLVLNGYLSGREFFEMVAIRHWQRKEMRTLRRKNRLLVFGSGVMIALFMMIPVVNLLTPLFGAAIMVHVVQSVMARA